MNKKSSIIFLTLIVVVMALIGCSKEDQESHASILKYNDQLFIAKGFVEKDSYPDILTTEKTLLKVKSNELPQTHLSSNELPEGTKIFIIDEHTILAELDDKKYQLYELKK